MYLVLVTLLEVIVLRDSERVFLLFARYVVEPTLVDLTTRSRHQPQGVSPRLFRLHPATKPTWHSVPGTLIPISNNHRQRNLRTKNAQGPQSLLVVSTGHLFSIT